VNAPTQVTTMLACDLARKSGVPQLTLRRWARAGLIPFQLDSSGRRIYDETSLRRAKELRNRKSFKLRDPE
jgi:DNA-binding transcriptional MerR regulator